MAIKAVVQKLELHRQKVDSSHWDVVSSDEMYRPAPLKPAGPNPLLILRKRNALLAKLYPDEEGGFIEVAAQHDEVLLAQLAAPGATEVCLPCLVDRASTVTRVPVDRGALLAPPPELTATPPTDSAVSGASPETGGGGGGGGGGGSGGGGGG